MDYRQYPPSDRVEYKPNAREGWRESALATAMAMPEGMRGLLAMIWGLGNTRGPNAGLPSVPLSRHDVGNALATAVVNPSLQNRNFDFMSPDLMRSRHIDDSIAAAQKEYDEMVRKTKFNGGR